MPKIPVITPETVGVDMKVNPLFLGANRLSFASNIAFEEGTIKTRPDFRYVDLGVSGVFQGSGVFTPSLGLSATPFGPKNYSLIVAAEGAAYSVSFDNDQVSSTKITEVDDSEPMFFESAENYLIGFGPNQLTFWWNDYEGISVSPGYTGSGGDEHDTFDTDKHVNWLPHCMTQAAYIHGRLHCSVPFTFQGCPASSELFVSDLITKRGMLSSDDILKMTEQALDSCGGPLVAPSRHGATVALAALLDNKNNGEAVLLDFRENGVVTHDTLQAPRETLINAQNGEITVQGWDSKRLTNTRFHDVSACGPRAVQQLPSDVIFRSNEGMQSFIFVSGIGTINDETTNIVSVDVDPLLDEDDLNLLSGASVGYWVSGDRFLVSTGLQDSPEVSILPSSQGFASYNKSTTYTEDRTPRPTWEGLWHPGSEIAGVHDFHQLGVSAKDRSFGFTASTSHKKIVFGHITENQTGFDYLEGKAHPIQWAVETGAFSFSGLQSVDELTGGVIDLTLYPGFKGGKVFFRSDLVGEWQLWSDIPASEEGEEISWSLGAPAKRHREATWFQFRVEGFGGAEVLYFVPESSKISRKLDGRKSRKPKRKTQKDYFSLRHE